MSVDEIVNQIHPLRDYLVKIAFIQLRDMTLAEDLAQDTMLAAIQAADRFEGRSKVKTWVTSILRNKIIDAIRAKQRAFAHTSIDAGADDDFVNVLFSDGGTWEEKPASWGDGEFDLSQKQFMAVLDICIEKLPPNQGRAFVMKEVLEMGPDEICKSLEITPSNMWVLLHRARLVLQSCLDTKWFANKRDA
ncbi:MAG: sigma-70 family RNA polymerase sigma factor [Betaproteobacteria bacterium]